ncbi:U-box/RING-like protein [Spodoptera frugiperda granulovirus]|uniref:Ac53 n=1 Tax=Spodoptera frugiperda granulovirus TaxID=307454 RepID=A0A0C5AQB4_9BBAC|nr:U-box/RING-like protein [Spodoptera frugiperda granulovirus]AJK91796.1 U-box/RING-like protein [Spodoptera frugiperda granulovirus]AXS01160.1 ac53 [Spodoptera frugiperda granulovirus]
MATMTTISTACSTHATHCTMNVINARSSALVVLLSAAAAAVPYTKQHKSTSTMEFFITTESCARPKEFLEKILIGELGEDLECAICCSAINKYQRGVVNITCGGMADLEHLFCETCDKKFQKNDPYKRKILYRFTFPFSDDNAALSFIEKSEKFILNEDDERKQRELVDTVKNIPRKEEYRDVSFNFDLGLKPHSR